MATTVLERRLSDYSEWEPKEYIAEYYSEILTDCRYASEWLVESMQKTPSVPVALEFGCGPIPVFTLPLVKKVREIHLAEYLPSNRQEIEKWISGAEDAHDWRAFTEETLRLEGNDNPSDAEVAARDQETRARITRVLPADVTRLDPLGADMRGFYPLVTTHCCAEAVTTDKDTWRTYLRNIVSLLKPGGTLILSACEAAPFYCVRDRRYPCAGVTRHDLPSCLGDLGFGDMDLRVRQVPDNSEQGFSSIVFARAILGSAGPGTGAAAAARG